MTRRDVLIAVAAVLISAVAIILGWKIGQDRSRSAEVQEAGEPKAAIIEGEAMTAQLFFPGPGGRLFTEEREIPLYEDPLAQLRQVLEQLMAGPMTEELFPALPPEVTVDWLYLNPAGVFYVDLKFSGESVLPAWGSRQEMLAVYSIVNTLLANNPEINSVVLLRNGQQNPTFAGHLDTSRPLLANQQLITTR